MSKVLVNIHGAGKQMSNFYVEGLNALGRIMGHQPACLPCWYADLSNIGSPVFGPDDLDLPQEAIDFRTAFAREIRMRRKAIEAQAPVANIEFGLMDDATLVADVIGDVTRYLFDPELQKQTRQRLRETLERAKQQADETILVSHSLGTVVAFDVMRTDAQRYNVSQFVTMGSPLRKLVNLRQRSSDIGTISARTVSCWRNLYDTTDPIADAIGPAFPGYPIQDVFIDVHYLPIQSHDYWRNEQVLEMIAGMLR